jgi:hypothetical protein
MFVRRAALLVAFLIATCVALVGQFSVTASPDSPSNAQLHAPRDQRAVELLSTAIGDRVATIVHAVALDWDHDGDVDVVAASRDADLVLWINDGRGHLEPHRVKAQDRLTSRSLVLKSQPTDDSPAMPSSGHRLHDVVLVVSSRDLQWSAALVPARERVASIVTGVITGPGTRAPPSTLS